MIATVASVTSSPCGFFASRCSACASISTIRRTALTHASDAASQPFASSRSRPRCRRASSRSKPPASADACAYSDIVASVAATAACLTTGDAAAHDSSENRGRSLAR